MGLMQPVPSMGMAPMTPGSSVKPSTPSSTPLSNQSKANMQMNIQVRWHVVKSNTHGVADSSLKGGFLGLLTKSIWYWFDICNDWYLLVHR